MHFKTMVLMGFLLTLTSCGADDNTTVDANCDLRLTFDASIKDPAPTGYVAAVYSAQTTSSCYQLLMNRSGGVKIGLFSTAVPSAAKLGKVNLGDKREIELGDSNSAAEPYVFNSGSVAFSREYQSGVSSEENLWLLPWADVPSKMSAVFFMISPFNQEYLPMSVDLSLSLLD